jgi:hypothetical protein
MASRTASENALSYRPEALPFKRVKAVWEGDIQYGIDELPANSF